MLHPTYIRYFLKREIHSFITILEITTTILHLNFIAFLIGFETNVRGEVMMMMMMMMASRKERDQGLRDPERGKEKKAGAKRKPKRG